MRRASFCLDHSNVCLLILGLGVSCRASRSSQHRLPVIQFLQQAYPPHPNLGISDGISHTATAGGVTVSSNEEAGSEEHSEAPVQTHQRQCGRLETNTCTCI